MFLKVKGAVWKSHKDQQPKKLFKEVSSSATFLEQKIHLTTPSHKSAAILEVNSQSNQKLARTAFTFNQTMETTEVATATSLKT